MASHESSTFHDVFKALNGSKTGPLPQGPRSDLDASLRGHTTKKLFTAMLDETNKGLGINTSVPLPPDKAAIYADHATRVQRGSMSSTEAFARSSYDWAKRGDSPGAVANGFGTVFAALSEGMEAHRKRVTGRY